MLPDALSDRDDPTPRETGSEMAGERGKHGAVGLKHRKDSQHHSQTFSRRFTFSPLLRQKSTAVAIFPKDGASKDLPKASAERSYFSPSTNSLRNRSSLSVSDHDHTQSQCSVYSPQLPFILKRMS